MHYKKEIGMLEMNFHTLFRSALLASVCLAAPGLFAADCKLAGVGFPGMNSDQVKTLARFGAACTAGDAGAESGAPRLGQPGFILVDGKKTSYLDLAADDPIKNSGKDVVLYGYLSYFSETEPFKVWGYRFDFQIYEGEWLSGIKVMNTSEPQIDVVVSPSKLKKYAEPLTDTLSQLRRDSFKALTLASGGKALVKITGKTGAYSNTGALYIGAESVEVIR